MEWISVKDRLPNNDERFCFVCINDDGDQSRGVAYFQDGTDASGNKINYFIEYYGGDGLISHVTHWMPFPDFPEPPKDK